MEQNVYNGVFNSIGVVDCLANVVFGDLLFPVSMWSDKELFIKEFNDQLAALLASDAFNALSVDKKVAYIKALIVIVLQ